MDLCPVKRTTATPNYFLASSFHDLNLPIYRIKGAILCDHQVSKRHPRGSLFENTDSIPQFASNVSRHPEGIDIIRKESKKVTRKVIEGEKRHSPDLASWIPEAVAGLHLVDCVWWAIADS
jgi:hypothetical protein